MAVSIVTVVTVVKDSYGCLHSYCSYCSRG